MTYTFEGPDAITSPTLALQITDAVIDGYLAIARGKELARPAVVGASDLSVQVIEEDRVAKEVIILWASDRAAKAAIGVEGTFGIRGRYVPDVDALVRVAGVDPVLGIVVGLAVPHIVVDSDCHFVFSVCSLFSKRER